MIVDISFRLIGDNIPTDHGYVLYSGLSTLLPILHNVDWLAVHPISGLPTGNGTLRLTKNSRLRLRLQSERLSEVIPLAGKRLALFNTHKESRIRLGVPEVYALKPSDKLYSRCVVIKISDAEKNTVAPTREMFITAIRKKLQEQNISGDVWIDDKPDHQGHELSRRIIHIKGQKIVGYSVQIGGLSVEDSIKLQEIGVGGRQKMCCGVFVPVRERG
ncbi:MAG: type I-MYXAN CRISPR-associated protein Cas6/Cmx6 [Acidobacteriota bacterium]